MMFPQMAFKIFPLFSVLAVLACGIGPARADEPVQGVNPRDNIRKAEVLYKFDSLRFDQQISSVTLKYDTTLSKEWGVNVEVPFVAYKGFGLEQEGVGDVNLRIRYSTTINQVSYIAGLELVTPTAANDLLGLGKWQINPVGGIVVSPTQFSFLFLGYKHFYSVAGDDERHDINGSQPRAILGYTSPKGWWALADFKYTKSWTGLEDEAFDAEVELGTMIAPRTGIWARAGTSFLDSPRDYGINLGVRQIF